MSRWLDTYFAKSADTPSLEKKTHKGPSPLPTKPTKPASELGFGGFVGFVGASVQGFAKFSNIATAPPDPAAEAAERAVSIPRGYTNAELEAARRDAERLGYGRGGTVH